MVMEFDKIDNLTELIDYVKHFALPVDAEAICKMQDIIGHSTENALAEKAKEDPKFFYFILDHVWDFERCVWFYNKYSNPVHEERLRLIEKNNKLMKENEEKEKNRVYLREQCTHLIAQVSDFQKKLKEAKEHEESYKAKIIILKAKIYDMMEAANVTEEEKTTP